MWLLHRASLRRLFAVSVFLKCGEETRLRRRLARDLHNRGRSADSIREQFRLTVAPMHRRFVEPQRQWAQFILRRAPTASKVQALAELLSALSMNRLPERGQLSARESETVNSRTRRSVLLTSPCSWPQCAIPKSLKLSINLDCAQTTDNPLTHPSPTRRGRECPKDGCGCGSKSY